MTTKIDRISYYLDYVPNDRKNIVGVEQLTKKEKSLAAFLDVEEDVNES